MTRFAGIDSRARSLVRRSPLGLPTLVVLCAGCSDSRPPTDPPADTIPPAVAIAFPGATGPYDETSNGLLDLRASWSDAGGVDASSVRVLVDGDDVTDTWTRHAADEMAGRFEETLEGLAGPGAREIVVAVADTAGNVGTDTVMVQLAYGDFHLSLPLGGELGVPASDVEYCPDDGRIYVAHGQAIEVFETWPPSMVDRFATVLAQNPSRLLCIEGDPFLYAMVRVERFDRTMLEWASHIPGTFLADGVVQSRKDPAIIWVGEDGPGVPVRVDVVAEERLSDPAFPVSSQSGEFTFSIAVLKNDEKIYYTRFFEGGVVVSDPATGTQLDHIDLDPSTSGRGVAANIVLHPDGDRLYAATRVSNPGLVEVSTSTDAYARSVSVEPNAALDVAIDDAGSRLWVTVQDFDPADPASSLLVDPETMSVLQAFPRPVPPGTETTWVLAAEFAGEGKLLFQARDDWLDVYLIR